MTSGIVRTWQQRVDLHERRQALITVDHIWWDLRSKLDAYLEVWSRKSTVKVFYAFGFSDVCRCLQKGVETIFQKHAGRAEDFT